MGVSLQLQLFWISTSPPPTPVHLDSSDEPPTMSLEHLLTPPAITLPRATLTLDQTTQLAELIEHFSAKDLKLAIAEGSDDTAPLTEREMMFLVSAVRHSS